MLNQDIIQGKWNELKGDIQSRWARLTNDDLEQINGERTKLLGRIQASYGVAREEAEKQLKDWEGKIADKFDA